MSSTNPLALFSTDYVDNGLLVIPPEPGKCGGCGEMKSIFVCRNGHTFCVDCTRRPPAPETSLAGSRVQASSSHVHKFVSCVRKEHFSFRKAQRIAKRLRRKTHEPIHAYRCDFCRYWHVGQDNEHKIKKAMRKGAGA